MIALTLIALGGLSTCLGVEGAWIAVAFGGALLFTESIE